MKKSILALAVAALAAASTVSATTVYDKDGTTLGFHGRVQSVFYSGNQNNAKDEQAVIKSSGRFGIDLRSQITSGAAAFAMAEWDMSDGTDHLNHFDIRSIYAGVDFGQFGTVTVGRFDPAGKYAMFATDIFDDYGCYGYTGNDDKRDGTVQYQWSGYGFTALISYAFADKGTNVDGAYWAGNGIAQNRSEGDLETKYDLGIGLGYVSPDILFGPIDVRVSFSKGELNNSDKAKDGVSYDPFNPKAGFDPNKNSFVYDDGINRFNSYYDSYTGYAFGIGWGKLNIGPYVGAQYAYRKLDANFIVTGNSPDLPAGEKGEAMDSRFSGDAKQTGYEFAVGYSFANGVTIRTGYQAMKFEDFDGEKVKSATVPVYANWQLTPAFQVWGEARFDAGTDDSKTGGKNFQDTTGYNLEENVYSFGMRYSF